MCIFKRFVDLVNDFFGKPGTGIHSWRFLDSAFVDYQLTLIGAMIMSFMTSIPLVLSTIFLLVLSILVHILFGVETSSSKYLGF